jgi:hypothetical protein
MQNKQFETDQILEYLKRFEMFNNNKKKISEINLNTPKTANKKRNHHILKRLFDHKIRIKLTHR